VPELTFSFDPVVLLSETASVRLETIALALVLLVGLLLAARAASGPSDTGLRLDDLTFMIIGAVPGAIFGGRLGYVLDHLDFYRANPAAIIDPGQGALTLTLAVPFGILTGSVIARLLGAPIRRWMHALTLPLMFTLAAGKIVGVFGGSGQGAPTDSQWATAFVGVGPWGSLAADVPAHPSQVYEAVLIGVAVVVMAVIARTRFARRDSGVALFIALSLWAIARFVVAFTWRDPALVGPLRMEQILLIGVVIVALIGFRRCLQTPQNESIPAPVEQTSEPALDGGEDANPA
jgi:phosphatidylglycerol---prolipoprotein diacylglyceryl transferase